MNFDTLINRKLTPLQHKIFEAFFVLMLFQLFSIFFLKLNFEELRILFCVHCLCLNLCQINVRLHNLPILENYDDAYIHLIL